MGTLNLRPARIRSSITTALLLAVLGLAGCTDTGADEADSGQAGEVGGKGDFFGDDVTFADLYRGVSSPQSLPVRGRLVEVDESEVGDPNVSAFSQFSQDEIKNETVMITLSAGGDTFDLGSIRTDSEGYFDELFDVSALELPPGPQRIEVVSADEVVGSTRITLLDAGRTAPVIRSDLDMTYLATEFGGTADKLRLLQETAEDKDALPGMDVLYRQLRGHEDLPISFLSGSPRFFKRTLEAKLALDGVEQDGLVLKPFKDLVAEDLLGFDFASILPDLQEQVGYKLSWLLRLRLQLPPSTPEILLGDDTEADVVVYNLYTRVLTGELDAEALEEELALLDVGESWRDEIAALVPHVRELQPVSPVAIYINATPNPGETHAVEDWQLSTVRYHVGAWPLALDMFEEDWLEQSAVLGVRDELQRLGQSPTELNDSAMAEFIEAETRSRFEL